jgi:hypothetical protein
MEKLSSVDKVFDDAIGRGCSAACQLPEDQRDPRKVTPKAHQHKNDMWRQRSTRPGFAPLPGSSNDAAFTSRGADAAAVGAARQTSTQQEKSRGASNIGPPSTSAPSQIHPQHLSESCGAGEGTLDRDSRDASQWPQQDGCDPSSVL